MRRPSLAAVAGAALLGLALTACGGSSGMPAGMGSAAQVTGTGAHQTVTIQATNMFRFTPMQLTAHPGTLTITLVDSGSYPHNIDFPTLHVKSSTVSGDAGNTKAAVTLHLTAPGSYPFICTYHSTAGMKGVLTVKR